MNYLRKVIGLLLLFFFGSMTFSCIGDTTTSLKISNKKAHLIKIEAKMFNADTKNWTISANDIDNGTLGTTGLVKPVSELLEYLRVYDDSDSLLLSLDSNNLDSKIQIEEETEDFIDYILVVE